MSNIISGLIKEIHRNRELLVEYEKIPTGFFGASVIREKISRAEKAVESGCVVEMVTAYKELQRSE